MKKLITTTVIALFAVSSHAASFDYERQFGTAELFPTQTTDAVTATARINGDPRSAVFAHERAFGTAALYPTLVIEQVDFDVGVGARPRERFEYWANVWNTDVETGG